MNSILVNIDRKVISLAPPDANEGSSDEVLVLIRCAIRKESIALIRAVCFTRKIAFSLYNS